MNHVLFQHDLANIYFFNLAVETLEKGVKYVQS